MNVIKDKPVMLQTNSPVIAYVPKATTQTPGIVSYNPRDFSISPDGVVSLRARETKYIHNVLFRYVLPDGNYEYEVCVRGIIITSSAEVFDSLESLYPYLKNGKFLAPNGYWILRYKENGQTSIDHIGMINTLSYFSSFLGEYIELFGVIVNASFTLIDPTDPADSPSFRLDSNFTRFRVIDNVQEA